MRAFVAVELPEAAREEVERLQETLQRSGADVKWVEPENLHLTLKFLGEIPEDQAGQVEEALRSAISSFRPFSFQLKGIGAFPRVNSPRVLWVGVGEGNLQLTELGATVEKCCLAVGFPAEDRPFSPHLTIGRIRPGPGLTRLIQQLEAAEFRCSAPAPVERIILFQSVLSAHSPTYSRLIP